MILVDANLLIYAKAASLPAQALSGSDVRNRQGRQDSRRRNLNPARPAVRAHRLPDAHRTSGSGSLAFFALLAIPFPRLTSLMREGLAPRRAQSHAGYQAEEVGAHQA